MRNLGKILISLLGVVALAGRAHAITIVALDGEGHETQVLSTWSAYGGSPVGGTSVTDINGDGSDWEVLVGLSDFGNAEGGTQTSGIYGGGTILAPNDFGYKVYFDFDGYTWDSYNGGQVAPNPGASIGYWDLFALNINQTDFYWNLVNGGSGSLSDPVVNNVPAGTPTVSFGAIDGVTWGWGGKDYAAGYFEENHGHYSIFLQGNNESSYFVSAVLDTHTSPSADSNYSSWGGFNANGPITPPTGGGSQNVPEPSSLFLIASGLLGIGAWARRK